MKNLTAFILLLLCSSYLFAQSSIQKMEYWIDADPGIGKATDIGGFAQMDEVAHSFVIPVPGSIATGLHTLGIRSRDNSGRWSHTNVFPIYVSDSLRGVLTDLEFYWETEADPGFGAAHKAVFNPTMVSAFEGSILASPPPNLMLGTYTLYMRSKGTRGEWSHTNHLQVQIDSIVSADDLRLQTGIGVFPNPFMDEVTVVPSEDGKMRVTIYDQSGRLVGDVTLQGETTLDMSQLSSGAYTALFWKGGTRIYKMHLLKI